MGALELNDGLAQHCRKQGDAPLNAEGRQGTRALRKWRRLFKDELQCIADEECSLHKHDEPMTHAECLARSLWRLALGGERWACNLLLLRWIGRCLLRLDLQQPVSIDLTQMFDERALQRYRHLVTHEDSLTPDEAAELQHYRFRRTHPWRQR